MDDTREIAEIDASAAFLGVAVARRVKQRLASTPGVVSTDELGAMVAVAVEDAVRILILADDPVLAIDEWLALEGAVS